MITANKVLVKRDAAKGHEETTIRVDWTGVTEEEIKLMASYYIQHRVEHELKGNETKLPEMVTVFAYSYLHKPVVEEKTYNVPASWRAPPESKSSKAAQTLKAALKNLSKEELRILLGE